LVESWQNYLAAKANKESFKKQVEANKVSLEGTMEEMRVGTKILLDVLNAQSELLKAQLSLVRAEETYLLEGFKLLSHMGILTAKGLKLKVPYHDPDVHYNSTKNRI
jgi:outer membrane protein TolC